MYSCSARGSRPSSATVQFPRFRNFKSLHAGELKRRKRVNKITLESRNSPSPEPSSASRSNRGRERSSSSVWIDPSCSMLPSCRTVTTRAAPCMCIDDRVEGSARTSWRLRHFPVPFPTLPLFKLRDQTGYWALRGHALPILSFFILRSTIPVAARLPRLGFFAEMRPDYTTFNGVQWNIVWLLRLRLIELKVCFLKRSH